MNDLVNVHPADELAALREEIKQMQTRADELRDVLLAPGANLTGDQYQAGVIPSTRETLDKAAIVAELGREAVERFIKTTVVKTVKLFPINQKE